MLATLSDSIWTGSPGRCSGKQNCKCQQMHREVPGGSIHRNGKRQLATARLWTTACVRSSCRKKWHAGHFACLHLDHHGGSSQNIWCAGWDPRDVCRRLRGNAKERQERQNAPPERQNPTRERQNARTIERNARTSKRNARHSRNASQNARHSPRA